RKVRYRPGKALRCGESRRDGCMDGFLPDSAGEQRLCLCGMRETAMSTTADFSLTRRAFLGHYAGCLGSLALAHLLHGESEATELKPPAAGLLAAKRPHHSPRAKAVICLFQHGGPSQMDLFDPKPQLTKHHGKPYPGELEAHFHTQVGKVLGSPFKFTKAGQCGMELSEILPHTAKIADDFTLIRSMMTESVDHEAALRMIHSGKTFAGRPVLGSWVLYGLGAERQDLPAYVVLT